MMKKHWCKAAVLAISAVLLTGCRSASVGENIFAEAEKNHMVQEEAENENVIYMTLTHSDTEGSLVDQAARLFQNQVESLSDGEMKVEIYPNDTLGTLEDSQQNLNDAIQFRIGSGPCTTMRIVSWLPVLMKDCDLTYVESQLDYGEGVWNILNEEAQQMGFRILDIFPATYRILTSNQKVKSAEDLAKLKIRVISPGLESELWGMTGAETQAFSIDQVYLALQQGIVDSEENTIAIIQSHRLYEQQKYFIRTNHKIYADVFYMNGQFYENLLPEQQELIDQAAENTRNALYILEETYLGRMDELQNQYGVEVISWSKEEQQKLMELWREPVQDLLKEKYGQDKVDEIVQICTKK
ncbi:MAG: TRAP transporter substrate-binding protein [Clostridiales bacterium]|nr:TRAP transporter substrate-binding protein [Clostridiales bacterium]